jgi:hypothetical protein
LLGVGVGIIAAGFICFGAGVGVAVLAAFILFGAAVGAGTVTAIFFTFRPVWGGGVGVGVGVLCKSPATRKLTAAINNGRFDLMVVLLFGARRLLTFSAE